MDAGLLNRRIEIQTRQAGRDAAGQRVMTWTTTYAVWANIKGATGLGSTKMQSDMIADINTYSFRIRYLSAVNAGMRIVYNSQNYDIKRVRHDMDRQDWTDLVAEVGGNDG